MQAGESDAAFVVKPDYHAARARADPCVIRAGHFILFTAGRDDGKRFERLRFQQASHFGDHNAKVTADRQKTNRE